LILLHEGASSELSSRLTGTEVEAIRDGIRAAEGEHAKVSPETYFIISLARRRGTGEVNVPVRGVGTEGMGLRSGFRILSGRMSMRGAHELLGGKRAAEEYAALAVGAPLTIGRQLWRVVGVFETAGGLASSEIWGDPYLLQTAFDRGNAWQLVVTPLPRPTSQFDIELQLSRDKRLQVRSEREDRHYALQSRSLALFIQFVGRLLSLAMGTIALFVVLASMYAAVAARQREIAILRAIGFGGIPILCSVIEEAVFLAAAGGLLGGLLAYIAFNGRQLSTLNLNGSFTQIPFSVIVTAASLRSGILMGVMIGILAGIGPGVRAIRSNVATTLTAIELCFSGSTTTDIMNKVSWLALSLLWVLSVPQVSACVDAGIEKWYQQENVAALDRQLSSLAAKASQSRADVLQLGLAAYRVADLKLLKGDKDGASEALSTAATILKDRLEKGKDAELSSLLALVYGLQIRISPFRGMWLGSSADHAVEDALAAEPNNPRPHFAAGVNLLYKPGSLGGGAEKALAQLQRAVDLYAASATKNDPDGACWGADDATLALARAKLKMGGRVAAIGLVETVLARSPGSRPAQRLMDAIRRAGTEKGEQVSERAATASEGDCTIASWEAIDARIGAGFATQDADGLRALEAELAGTDDETPWRSYYRALAAFRLGGMARLSADERGAALERAHQHLEGIEPASPSEEAEKLVLLGCIAGLLVRHTAWGKSLRG